MAERQEVPYSNKMATIQVIGALAKDPMILKEGRYRLSPNDFPEDFHRIVFKAIVGIAIQSDDGEIDIERIDPIDIDRYLKPYPEAYPVFTANDGVDWVRKAMDSCDTGKFHFYYNILKKYSLLNSMSKLGLDTRRILDPDVVEPKKIMEMREKFDAMSTKDILAVYETDIVKLKERYDSSDDLYEAHAGASIMETIAETKRAPVVGPGFSSPFLTSVYRGMRLGTVLVESAPQGVGKSRRQAGESAYLAVPEYYDNDSGEWIHTGHDLSILLISSELTQKEVQYMWLANIAGVPEERIVGGAFDDVEYARMLHAAELLEKSSLYFVEISNYDVDDIENLMKKYALTKHVTHFFFDYVGTTKKIMNNSSRGLKDIRGDQILLFFMERLKNLAKIMNIAIYTATQISGNWKEIKEADQQMIRDAKSIADKPDGGWILLPVRESDRAIIDQYMAKKGFAVEPTHVMHIYKNRGNPYVNIRIYGKFTRNMSRWVDCFATDFSGHFIDIKPIKVVWDEKPKEEVSMVHGNPTLAINASGDYVRINPDDPTMPVNDELPSFSVGKTTDEGGWGAGADDYPYEPIPDHYVPTNPAETAQDPAPEQHDEPAQQKESTASWGKSADDWSDDDF